MSKTSLEIVTILAAAIRNSPVFTGDARINGGIYKFKRPVNSPNEDIVVNSLPINYEQLQEGVLNVNIHVPNLIIEVNGVNDNTQPDTRRLEELLAVATATLREINSPDGQYSFTLQQDNLFEGEYNDHYINLRYEFYSINI